MLYFLLALFTTMVLMLTERRSCATTDKFSALVKIGPSKQNSDIHDYRSIHVQKVMFFLLPFASHLEKNFLMYDHVQHIMHTIRRMYNIHLLCRLLPLFMYSCDLRHQTLGHCLSWSATSIIIRLTALPVKKLYQTEWNKWKNILCLWIDECRIILLPLWSVP